MRNLILILTFCFPSFALADEVVMLSTGNCQYCDAWEANEKPLLANSRVIKLRKFPTFLLVRDGTVQVVEGYQPAGRLRALLSAMRRKPVSIPAPAPNQ